MRLPIRSNIRGQIRAGIPETAGDMPPRAKNVKLQGFVFADQTVTCTYKYEGSDPQSGTTFQWYSSNTELEAGTAIPGATAQTYVVAIAVGKYLSCIVTPRDAARTGNPVESARSLVTDGLVLAVESIDLTPGVSGFLLFDAVTEFPNYQPESIGLTPGVSGIKLTTV